MSSEERVQYLEKVHKARIHLKQYYLDNYLPSVYYNGLNGVSAEPSFSTSASATLPSARSPSPDDIEFFGSDPIEPDIVDNGEPTQELDQFFRAFRRCKDVDPLQWWRMNVAQYPNLARLARDILSIPGSSSEFPLLLC